MKTEIKNILYIIAGLLCCMVAYNIYLIPYEIAAGGFTGVGQLINSLTGGRIPVGAVSIALNVPLFLLSMRSLGLRFGIRSFLSSLGLSLVTMGNISFGNIHCDMLLASVFGGVVGGIGFGLILRGNATTGGTDMLGTLLNRLIPTLRVSVAVFAADAIVIIASAFVFDEMKAMYALISTFIMNVLLDIVLEGPEHARAYYIISDNYDMIAERIMKELERGVTGLNGSGMYSSADKKVLLCVVSRFESGRLRSIVKECDPNAFVIVTNVHEALGEGFKDR